MEPEQERAQLCLSLVAYAGSSGEPSRSSEALGRTISNWLAALDPTREHELVWGPASFRMWWQGSAPAVVVFVTRGGGAYHVVIRGGAPLCGWDHCLDSLAWLEQEPWSWARGIVNLAPAMCSGVHRQLMILRELIPEDALAGAGRTLAEFLAARVSELEADRKLPVHVVGHGLGGALALAAALWLRDTQGKVRTRDLGWDPDCGAKLHCRAFATPSVGNGDFASYVGERLGSQLDLIQNSLDPATALWDTEALLDLAGRYAPHVRESVIVRAFAEALANEVERCGVEYEQPQLRIFDGQVNASLPRNFAAQAEYQHLHGYLDLLGLAGRVDVDAIFDRISGTDDGPVAQ